MLVVGKLRLRKKEHLDRIIYLFFYFISFANRQGHRNSLRQLLRARN